LADVYYFLCDNISVDANISPDAEFLDAPSFYPPLKILDAPTFYHPPKILDAPRF
jgi:hypothetical protein